MYFRNQQTVYFRVHTDGIFGYTANSASCLGRVVSKTNLTGYPAAGYFSSFSIILPKNPVFSQPDIRQMKLDIWLGTGYQKAEYPVQPLSCLLRKKYKCQKDIILIISRSTFLEQKAVQTTSSLLKNCTARQFIFASPFGLYFR